jgi:hypothetical protein
LGDWRSLSMVERYSHLSPDHLLEAVEKLVRQPAQAPIELDANLTSLHDEGSRSGEERGVSAHDDNAEGWPSPVEGVRLEIG